MRAGGSPNRRSVSMILICTPLTFLTASRISRTLEARAVAAVEYFCSSPSKKVRQGQKMGLGQILYMDIVTDAGSIRGRVIRTID